MRSDRYIVNQVWHRNIPVGKHRHIYDRTPASSTLRWLTYSKSTLRASPSRDSRSRQAIETIRQFPVELKPRRRLRRVKGMTGARRKRSIPRVDKIQGPNRRWAVRFNLRPPRIEASYIVPSRSCQLMKSRQVCMEGRRWNIRTTKGGQSRPLGMHVLIK
jgi:hypothetical protein